MRHLPGLLVVFTGLACAADPALAEGKYTRRQRARGEVTDTAPKLDRYAFIDDSAPKPRELVLIVDTWNARVQRDPKLLPLVVALSYEGDGEPLPIRPDRFELWWEGSATPVKALSHEELTCEAGEEPCRGTTGPSPVHQDALTLSRRAPLAFDTPRATWVPVRFYTHPALSGMRHDRLLLPSQRWFSTLAYFPVPAELAQWDGLFELRYVPEDGKPPAVACRFRIQRAPALQQDAMRRARKDLRREERE